MTARPQLLSSAVVCAFLLIALNPSLAEEARFSASPDSLSLAYQRYEESLRFSCNYADSAFLSFEDRLEFGTKNQIETQSNLGRISPGRYQASAQIRSSSGTVDISISVAMDHDRLAYSLQLRDFRGRTASSTGLTEILDFPLPKRDQIKDPELSDLAQKLRLDHVSCTILRSRNLTFSPDDMTRTIHAIVHPIQYYDQNSKLRPQIEYWAAQEGFRSIVLLETESWRNAREVIQGLPYRSSIEPRLTFRPRAGDRFEVAGNGVITIEPLNGMLPSRFVVTGAWFNACVTHFLDNLLYALVYAPHSDSLWIGLPVHGILVQENGESGMSTYPGMKLDTSLEDLRKEDPEVFMRLMDRFVAYHLENWKNNADPALASVLKFRSRRITIELLDVDGKTLIQRSWGDDDLPLVRLQFQLLGQTLR